MKKLLTEWRQFLKEQQPVVKKQAVLPFDIPNFKSPEGKVDAAAVGGDLALAALSRLGPLGAAVATAIGIGAAIGMGINASADLIKDVMKNKRIHSANPADLVANIERLIKQSQTKGIDKSGAEELVHSWISLAGKNEQAAKKYVRFLKLLKASKAGKVFPPYIQLK